MTYTVFISHDDPTTMHVKLGARTLGSVTFTGPKGSTGWLVASWCGGSGTRCDTLEEAFAVATSKANAALIKGGFHG